VKVGVSHAVRARRIAGLLFFNGTMNCERYVQVILVQSFPELTVEDPMAGFNKTQLRPTLHVCLCKLCLIPSGTEISALVFGRHIHPTLILMIFPSVVLCRTKFKTVNTIWKNYKNIHREIANIPAEQIQGLIRTSSDGARNVNV
jgi:hypothetical protein